MIAQEVIIPRMGPDVTTGAAGKPSLVDLTGIFTISARLVVS
jgi:hypothetical protein